jgi:hypothetical protein
MLEQELPEWWLSNAWYALRDDKGQYRRVPLHKKAAHGKRHILTEHDKIILRLLMVHRNTRCREMISTLRWVADNICGDEIEQFCRVERVIASRINQSWQDGYTAGRGGK